MKRLSVSVRHHVLPHAMSSASVVNSICTFAYLTNASFLSNVAFSLVQPKRCFSDGNQSKSGSSNVSDRETVEGTSEEGEDGILENICESEGEGGFDAVEATLQELHDLTLAIEQHLGRMRGDELGIRCHPGGLRGRAAFSCNPSDVTTKSRPRIVQKYCTMGDAADHDKLYDEYMTKVFYHLRNPIIMQQMTNSTSKGNIERARCRPSSSPRSVYRNSQQYIARWQFTCTSYHSMMRHAPFELEGVRSDMPRHVIKNSRSIRDRETMRLLVKLSCTPHRYRQQLQSRMTELLEGVKGSKVADHFKGDNLSNDNGTGRL
eukprot:Tbor_TRINITY_DN5183_c0_g1::TRINITY_DN5183_c0_g1_i1::g.25978::m.25978